MMQSKLAFNSPVEYVRFSIKNNIAGCVEICKDGGEETLSKGRD